MLRYLRYRLIFTARDADFAYLAPSEVVQQISSQWTGTEETSEGDKPNLRTCGIFGTAMPPPITAQP